MSNYKKKKNVKELLTIVSVCLVVVALLAGTVSLFSKNTVSLDYDIGMLGANGKYVESEKTLYTKESFECEAGLNLMLDFDSSIRYQVFFYDKLDKFVSCSETYDASTELNTPEGAARARILIIPIWGSDVKNEDRVINLLNKNSFAKQLSVEIIANEEVEDELAEPTAFVINYNCA